MAILITLRVFTINLLRRNRRKNTFCIFFVWLRARTLDLRLISQHTTYQSTEYTMYIFMIHSLKSIFISIPSYISIAKAVDFHSQQIFQMIVGQTLIVITHNKKRVENDSIFSKKINEYTRWNKVKRFIKKKFFLILLF